MKIKLINENFTENYVNNLLFSRGLPIDKLDYFYNVPDDSELASPLKLKNMGDAARKFVTEITNGHNICIVVDSDVDGFTSSSILYQYVKHKNPHLTIDYILHSGKGHGLSDTIDKILEADTHYDVVVLPDSSTNDKEYHDKLKEYGAWCLVLDHHLAESEEFSDNAIIVNNQISKDYVNKDLSGAGVTWQFCRFLDIIYGDNYANELIDLAALGIVSDMMNVLTLENRYIIHTGFNNIKNYFFKCLCNKQAYSMNNEVTPMTVAFYITPLINAMIRVGSMEEKERLFMAFVNGHELVPCNKRGAKGTFEECAVESARECTNARAKQNRILDKAVEELEVKIFKYDLLENKVLTIVLDEEDFPPELNGLIAMKLAAKYQKPTIVARLNDEGYVRGSSRGLNESELKSFKEFMEQSGLFEYTAGHDNACGISIPYKSLKTFEKYGNRELKDMDLGENFYEVNFQRRAMDTDISSLIQDICEYREIWGQHNEEPLIYIEDINITSNDIKIMGKNQDTVKIEKNGIAYMFFKCTKRLEEFTRYPEMKLNIVGKANINEWMGNYTPQIFVTDFEVLDGRLSF